MLFAGESDPPRTYHVLILFGQLPPAQCNRWKARRIWRQLFCVRRRATLAHCGTIFTLQASVDQIGYHGSDRCLLWIQTWCIAYLSSCGTSVSGVVVLSKQLVMQSRSSANGEPASKTQGASPYSATYRHTDIQFGFDNCTKEPSYENEEMRNVIGWLKTWIKIMARDKMLERSNYCEWLANSFHNTDYENQHNTHIYS